jgi:signal transduction histidine kinase
MYAVTTGMEKGDDERIARGWVMLSENVTRISQFVREFLDFARGREAQVRVCDPNEPLLEVGRMFAERATRAGIALEVHADPDLAPAAIDPDAIHTCLANLVSNAMDACLATEGERKCMVTMTSQEEDGVLIYEVVDNGHGMDAEITKRIFTQFFSTKGSNAARGWGCSPRRRSCTSTVAG